MTIKELFDTITTKGNELCYPFDYSTFDGDYLNYIQYLHEQYLGYIGALDPKEVELLNSSFDGFKLPHPLTHPLDLLSDVKQVTEVVQKAIKEIYRCYIEDAYVALHDFFEQNEHHYFNLLPQLIIYPCVPLYRMRKGKVDMANPQGELFHVPYHLRHLVATARYSIPGYPAMYLAGSFETAWREMDCPSFDDMTYAKMRFKNGVKFIDLAYPIVEHPQIWEYYSLFIFYPLLMACMVHVKYPDAPFKIEYSLPQLMLSIVRGAVGSDYAQGIVYMSDKAPDNFSIRDIKARNFSVIVRDTLHEEGWDTKLAQKMQMSWPVTFSSDDVKSLQTEGGDMDFELIEILNREMSYNNIVLHQK